MFHNFTFFKKEQLDFFWSPFSLKTTFNISFAILLNNCFPENYFSIDFV